MRPFLLPTLSRRCSSLIVEASAPDKSASDGLASAGHRHAVLGTSLLVKASFDFNNAAMIEPRNVCLSNAAGEQRRWPTMKHACIQTGVMWQSSTPLYAVLRVEVTHFMAACHVRSMSRCLCGSKAQTLPHLKRFGAIATQRQGARVNERLLLTARIFARQSRSGYMIWTKRATYSRGRWCGCWLRCCRTIRISPWTTQPYNRS